MATPHNPITSAEEWKAAATQGTPLKVPSGKTCLARNPGLPAFMQAGIVPNPLLAPVQEALSKGKPMENLSDVVGDDPERMQAFFELIDNVVMYCVLQPVVHSAHEELIQEDGTRVRRFIPEGERAETDLFIDNVDPEDRVFIFQWAVGGSSDLVKFRKEFRAAMADLSAGQNPAGSTPKRAPRAAPTRRTNGTGSRKAAASRKR